MKRNIKFSIGDILWYRTVLFSHNLRGSLLTVYKVQDLASLLFRALR